MKKFIIYLLVIVVAVSLGFAVFFLVRDNEVISISSATIYKDAGSQPFTIDVNHYNKKSSTKITISVSDDSVVAYDSATNSFTAKSGGISRINFRTTNAKFRNLWCDVVVGDGTEESPFYISTPEQLAAIGMGVANASGIYAGNTDYPQYTSDACYKLVADIDAKDINNGYWIPLRNFSGRLDGNGFKISNINIDRDSYVAHASQDNSYDPTLFTSENAGLFQKITSAGMVYNLKLENVSASGRYINFGTIAAINEGTIERIEVIDADLSVETEVFGGLVAKNVTTESGSGDTYVRNIARIDRCSINMILGKKTIYNPDGTTTDAVLGVTGIIGGLVGQNQGGNILYSYADGEVSFASDASTAIIYGGLVGTNRYITLTQFAGKYTSIYQGANIKDCYSNLKTNLSVAVANADTRIAGAIGINTDISESLYDSNPDKKIVKNYIIGVYYNKDNLNIEQENIAKNYVGIAEFICGTAIPYQDEKMVVYGLSNKNGANEMITASSYDSHTTYDISFDENGQSLGVQVVTQKWLFGTVWGMDAEVNNGMPYLNYQLVYIPDDFSTAGTPIVLQNNRYTFEKGDPDFPVTIVSGTNGRLTLMQGETYEIKITPAGSKVTWTTSDNSVVSVDANGKITAIQPGTANIVVTTSNGSTDSITVIVTDIAYSITNYPTQLTILSGDTYQLAGVSVFPLTTLTYSSVDTNIATVSASGLITGVNAGVTIVNITAGSTKAYISVTVQPKTADTNSVAITLDQSQYILTNYTAQVAGQINILSATCNGTDIKSQLAFEYISSDPNVVIVDKTTGAYTIVGTGKAYIAISVATSGYVGSQFMYFDISTQSASSTETLVFSQMSTMMYIGDTFQIVYSGTTQKPVFTSDNDSIATVDVNGLVRAISAGTTHIKGSIVKSDGTFATAICFVTVQDKAPLIITLSPTNQKIKVNSSITITATANKSSTYTWLLSDTNMASMTTTSDTATVTMNKVGKVILIAKSDLDSSVTASTTIEAYDPNTYSRDIYNVEQLNNVRNYLDKEFRLCANINLSGVNWTPIGTASSPFAGKFTNAGSYTISNLNTSGSNSGLFGYIKNATISGIKMTNANVTGENVGALVGTAYSSQINNCSVSNAKVEASYRAGGLVGVVTSNTVISNCQVDGSTKVTTSGSGTRYVGGIVGLSSSSNISGCTVNTSGNISLGSSACGYAGGIVGYTNSAITSCATLAANIIANNTDTNYSGGIAGYTTSTISSATIRNTSITGYYAGGIGGALNVNFSASLSFSEHKNGYRKSDLSSYSYATHVEKVAVKDTVKVTGNHIGGLFGVINSGVVKNSYTRANLNGNASNAIKGGFASYIYSSGYKNAGGSGQVGIVENCYSACTFSGSGTSYSVTASLIHNYAAKDTYRGAGYCFNYVFDNDLDGNATYYYGSNVFAKDQVQAKKSSSEMKNSSTYTGLGFSTSIWSFSGDYPSLNNER